MPTAEKRLQFGTDKCIKLHVGRSCNKSLCSDLYVDSWKVIVETDPESGSPTQSEHYAGMEKMKLKQEQTYLGDVISSDGKHTKNVQARKKQRHWSNNTDNTHFGYCHVWKILL